MILGGDMYYLSRAESAKITRETAKIKVKQQQQQHTYWWMPLNRLHRWQFSDSDVALCDHEVCSLSKALLHKGHRHVPASSRDGWPNAVAVTSSCMTQNYTSRTHTSYFCHGLQRKNIFITTNALIDRWSYITGLVHNTRKILMDGKLLLSHDNFEHKRKIFLITWKNVSYMAQSTL